MMTEHKKPVTVKTCRSGLHSIEDHNFWIDRNGVCPYCKMGSKAVHKSLIVKEVNGG